MRPAPLMTVMILSNAPLPLMNPHSACLPTHLNFRPPPFLHSPPAEKLDPSALHTGKQAPKKKAETGAKPGRKRKTPEALAPEGAEEWEGEGEGAQGRGGRPSKTAAQPLEKPIAEVSTLIMYIFISICLRREYKKKKND